MADLRRFTMGDFVRFARPQSPGEIVSTRRMVILQEEPPEYTGRLPYLVVNVDRNGKALIDTPVWVEDCDLEAYDPELPTETAYKWLDDHKSDIPAVVYQTLTQGLNRL